MDEDEDDDKDEADEEEADEEEADEEEADEEEAEDEGGNAGARESAGPSRRGRFESASFASPRPPAVDISEGASGGLLPTPPWPVPPPPPPSPPPPLPPPPPVDDDDDEDEDKEDEEGEEDEEDEEDEEEGADDEGGDAGARESAGPSRRGRFESVSFASPRPPAVDISEGAGGQTPRARRGAARAKEGGAEEVAGSYGCRGATRCRIKVIKEPLQGKGCCERVPVNLWSLRKPLAPPATCEGH